MRVSFNELAERELNDAARYYEREQPRLGAAFVTEIERCVSAIVTQPSPRLAPQPTPPIQPNNPNAAPINVKRTTW